MTWPQMNVLADSVSHLFKCPKLSLCKHYTPRIERPLVTWVSLSKPCITHSFCSLHGINMRWSRPVLIFQGERLCLKRWALLNFLLCDFSINIFFSCVFSPGEVTAQKQRRPRHRGSQGHNSASEKESRQAARNRHVFFVLFCFWGDLSSFTIATSFVFIP